MDKTLLKRMQEEAKELEQRITKLQSFVQGRSKTYTDLPDNKRVLLLNQADYMSRYLSILKQRIALEAN